MFLHGELPRVVIIGNPVLEALAHKLVQTKQRLLFLNRREQPALCVCGAPLFKRFSVSLLTLFFGFAALGVYGQETGDFSATPDGAQNSINGANFTNSGVSAWTSGPDVGPDWTIADNQDDTGDDAPW
jgi:hypothetical protein